MDTSRMNEVKPPQHRGTPRYTGHEKRLEVHVAVRVGDLADVDVQRGVHGLLVEARALSN